MQSKMRRVQSTLCATAFVAAALAAGGVQAAVFNFNYSNLGVTGGQVYDSVSMSDSGIGVTVTAVTVDNDNFGGILSLNSLSAGNGVYVSSTTSGNLGVQSSAGDRKQMDGGSVGDTTDPDEGLMLVFDQVVTLDYVNFDYFTLASADDFNLTVDGVTRLVDHNSNDVSVLVNNVAGQEDEFTFNGVSGTTFVFWADGPSDAFRLDRMTVSAVPVPAAVWLFVSGLLGLAGVARRRQ